ncbi:MAG: hypothetical protein ABSA96_13095 [Candidatus Acidiferrales bacterium]|jgi:hypothetical protein
MAISGLVNLLESNAQQQLGQDHSENNRIGAIGTSVIQNNTARTNAADRFTPSDRTTTAQPAGLFQIEQFATAVNLPLAQSAAPLIVRNAAPAQIPTAPSPAVVPAPVTQTTAFTPAAPATDVAKTTPTSQQDQLQTLNTALSDLGLDNTQISQVDQIASVIQNFSPTAYSDLVYQLQVLSQQSTQQTAAAAIGASNTSTNDGAFQVQELAVTFARLQGTPATRTANGNGNGQGAAGSTNQLSPFNLQVQDVQLTLSNNNGQTLQVRAGQPAASNASAE